MSNKLYRTDAHNYKSDLKVKNFEFSRKKIKGGRRGRSKKKETQKKIWKTLTWILLIPVLLLCFIYLQSSLLEIFFAIKLMQPPKSRYDIDGLGRGLDHWPDKYFPTKKNEPPYSDGGSYSQSVNNNKNPIDPTKYGWPYNWTSDESSVKQSIGTFFTTLWITVRTALYSTLETLQKTFYKELPDLSQKSKKRSFGDFMKFLIVLPIINTLFIIANYFITFYGIITACFDNQAWWAKIIWIILTFTVICIPIMGLMTIHLLGFLFKLSDIKVAIFRKFGKMYKKWWIGLIVILWSLIIPKIWTDTQYYKPIFYMMIAIVSMLFLSEPIFGKSI